MVLDPANGLYMMGVRVYITATGTDITGTTSRVVARADGLSSAWRPTPDGLAMSGGGSYPVHLSSYIAALPELIDAFLLDNFDVQTKWSVDWASFLATANRPTRAIGNAWIRSKVRVVLEVTSALVPLSFDDLLDLGPPAFGEAASVGILGPAVTYTDGSGRRRPAEAVPEFEELEVGRSSSPAIRTSTDRDRGACAVHEALGS